MSNDVPLNCSPLHGERDLEKIKSALKAGVNPNNSCLSGMTPLHWSRNGDITETLLKSGGKATAWDINLTTPLHLAPDAKSVYLLVQYGADPNAVDLKGNTPLHTAKNKEIVQALLKSGAKINAVNKKKQTPLDIYKEKLSYMPSHKEMIEALQDANTFSYETSHAQTNFLDIKTPLHNLLLDFYGALFLLACGAAISCFFSSSFLYIMGKKYTKHRVISILATPFLLFNPALIVSYYLLDFSRFLYIFQWMPKSLIYYPYIWVGGIFFLYHLLCFRYFARKYHEGFLMYCLKQLPYILIVPYWMLVVLVETETPGEAFGDYLAFFGFPYLILASLIGFWISKKIIKR